MSRFKVVFTLLGSMMLLAVVMAAPAAAQEDEGVDVNVNIQTATQAGANVAISNQVTNAVGIFGDATAVSVSEQKQDLKQEIRQRASISQGDSGE